MNIYDAKKDPEFQDGYIDVDEMRTRKLDDGTEIPFRYMHGGFQGTKVKFSFCFPEKDRYEGRFYQYLSPFPGPDEELASLPVTGIDDKIAFCLTHGAYYVESNMGSCAVFSNSEDNAITHRSSAASAEFSRVKAQEVYGYEHRPYGYVYGGSGGGYRTIACVENTNTYDGACPYVIGSPYAIPNCQSTRAHAERILRNKIPQIIDAVDAGGSGNPYDGLNEEETEALRELTLFGFPLKAWFTNADMNDGSLPVIAPGVKRMDPAYFEDFWKVQGYLGADPKGTAVRDRICLTTKVKLGFVHGEKMEAFLQKEDQSGIDTRNGVNDAWKKMISSAGENLEPWIEPEELPEASDGIGYYVQGLVATFLTGDAAGKNLKVKKIEDGRIYFTNGFGTDNMDETLELIRPGDEIRLDNSDYIAVQTYHRHQVPDKDYLAWDQFRDSEGNPLYPQRPFLVGPYFANEGPGCKENGQIHCKIIICAALMDEQAYPWQADWYRRKVASVYPGDEKDICRLWYFDNVLHDDITASANELYATTYIAGLKQALIDLAQWVEKGKEPLPSSNYKVDIGHVIVPDKADERGGIQAIPVLTANGSKCAHVKAGDTVQFEVSAEVPKGAGGLTFVEWSFEGEMDFPEKGEWELTEDGSKGTAKAAHVYGQPGTYFAVVRVKSERNGDKNQPFTQVRNIDRVRIIVE